MKKNVPNYLYKLIKKFPEILSGRKNYKDQHLRIIKNINITKKYIKAKSKN